MASTTAPPTDAAPGVPAIAPEAPATVEPEGEQRPAERLVEADLLVEDVSIDGMCGVY
jgi:mycofactocin precursor